MLLFYILMNEEYYDMELYEADKARFWEQFKDTSLQLKRQEKQKNLPPIPNLDGCECGFEVVRDAHSRVYIKCLCPHCCFSLRRDYFRIPSANDNGKTVIHRHQDYPEHQEQRPQEPVPVYDERLFIGETTQEIIADAHRHMGRQFAHSVAVMNAGIRYACNGPFIDIARGGYNLCKSLVLKEMGSEASNRLPTASEAIVGFRPQDQIKTLIDLGKEAKMAHLEPFSQLMYSALSVDAGSSKIFHFLSAELVATLMPIKPCNVVMLNVDQGQTNEAYLHYYQQLLLDPILAEVKLCGLVIDGLKPQVNAISIFGQNEPTFFLNLEPEQVKQNPYLRGLIAVVCLCHRTNNSAKGAMVHEPLFEKASVKCLNFIEDYSKQTGAVIPKPCSTRWLYWYDIAQWIVENPEKFEDMEVPIAVKTVYQSLRPLKAVSNYFERNDSSLVYAWPCFIYVENELSKLNTSSALAVKNQFTDRTFLARDRNLFFGGWHFTRAGRRLGIDCTISIAFIQGLQDPTESNIARIVFDTKRAIEFTDSHLGLFDVLLKDANFTDIEDHSGSCGITFVTSAGPRTGVTRQRGLFESFAPVRVIQPLTAEQRQAIIDAEKVREVPNERHEDVKINHSDEDAIARMVDKEAEEAIHDLSDIVATDHETFDEFVEDDPVNPPQQESREQLEKRLEREARDALEARKDEGDDESFNLAERIESIVQNTNKYHFHNASKRVESLFIKLLKHIHGSDISESRIQECLKVFRDWCDPSQIDKFPSMVTDDDHEFNLRTYWYDCFRIAQRSRNKGLEDFADLALRLLSLPCSESPSERQLKVLKYVSTRYATRMSDSTVKARVAIQTWG